MYPVSVWDVCDLEMQQQGSIAVRWMKHRPERLLNFCYDQNIAMTPYSALASGRLSRFPGETTMRMEQDSYAHFKYDATAEADGKLSLVLQRLLQNKEFL